MRGRQPVFGVLCFLMILIGVLILFVMVLPAGFWWFLLGCALILAGFRCARGR